MKLLILDGNSVLYRAYYAMPAWRNRSGEATAGVYGFLSSMLKAIEELKPTHLAIVFDTREENFRHQMYIGYQAKREKEEQVSVDIWGQVDKLKIVFEKLRLPVFQAPGFEADDVVGTLCRKIENLKSKIEVVAITGDRDLMQLVNDNVKLYMPKKGVSDNQLVGREEVKERLGVYPEKVVDYKALVGDGSDGYPGVVGIGLKTAIQLLDEFGSFQNLKSKIENLNNNEISKSNKEKLLKGWAGGELSYTLATIRRDVPIEFDLDALVIPDMEKMSKVFAEMGHKSLVRRSGGDVKDVIDDQQKLFE